jgi:hypothetical protein
MPAAVRIAVAVALFNPIERGNWYWSLPREVRG